MISTLKRVIPYPEVVTIRFELNDKIKLPFPPKSLRPAPTLAQRRRKIVNRGKTLSSCYNIYKQYTIYFHRNLSTLIGLDFGGFYMLKKIQEKFRKIRNEKKKNFPVLYLVSADNIKVNIKNYKEIIYQGTHGYDFIHQATTLLSTVTPLAYSGIYSDFFGRFTFTDQLIKKLALLKTNVAFIADILLGFLQRSNKNIEILREKMRAMFFHNKKLFLYFIQKITNVLNNDKFITAFFSYTGLFFEKLSRIEIRIKKKEIKNPVKLIFCKYIYSDYISKSMKNRIFLKILYNLQGNKWSQKKIIKTFPQSSIIHNHFLNNSFLGASLIMALGWLSNISIKNNFE